MESIFTYNPKKTELIEITGDDSISESDYLSSIKERARNRKSDPKYEILVDLEQLFAMRGDVPKAKEYSVKISTEFSDLQEDLFNE